MFRSGKLISRFLLLSSPLVGLNAIAQTTTSETSQATVQQLQHEIDELREEVRQLKADRAAPMSPGANILRREPQPIVESLVGPTSQQPAESLGSTSLSVGQVAPAIGDNQTSFAFADFTWLTGNPCTETPAFDSKFFTPEIRSDVNYTYDFRHPQDGVTPRGGNTGAPGSIVPDWTPDLRRSEQRTTAAILVKF